MEHLECRVKREDREHAGHRDHDREPSRPVANRAPGTGSGLRPSRAPERHDERDDAREREHPHSREHVSDIAHVRPLDVLEHRARCSVGHPEVPSPQHEVAEDRPDDPVELGGRIPGACRHAAAILL